MIVKEVGALYRLLGDEARLRILRLLSVERLNVTELTRVLGLAQSGVSRHLGLLKEAELVSEERDGGFSYYRLGTAVDGGAVGPVWGALQAQLGAANGDEVAGGDDARLQEVLRLRHEHLDAHGSETRQLVPGRSWAAWGRALGLLVPPLTVADLGCGEGTLTFEVAEWARRVVAVDRSAQVLARARATARRRGIGNVAWKRGEIEDLPLDDASVDVALLAHALHHAEDPGRALAEAARVTRPGGHVLVLDLRDHDQAWVRELGDRWLGFKDAQLSRLLRDAGLSDARVRVGASRSGDPFTVLVAHGRKRRKRREGRGGRGGR